MNIWPDPIPFLYATIFILTIMTILSILSRGKLSPTTKKVYFILIAAPVILTTLYMGAFTVHKNFVSETKGPVHWHADYEVWYCGERLDLVNPRGLSNKVGSPLFHEHNDDRMHVEGTVMRIQDVNLRQYFKVLGGDIGPGFLQYREEEMGLVDVRDGDLCPDGQPGTLKVWINGALREDFATHEWYPSPLVPPGDCFIVEFSSEPATPTTDRICSSWRVKDWNYDNYEELRSGS